MKLLLVMLLGLLMAQNPIVKSNFDTGSQPPKPIKELDLTYYDIKDSIDENWTGGQVLVEFIVNELGAVINPIIVDEFEISISDVILNKIKQITYHPATQNGLPVSVKMIIPIRFKE